MLDRSASGSRHIRWGLEVAGSMKAHLEINTSMTPEQRAALTAELEKFSAALDKLQVAYTPYRHFVENAFVELRCKQRVANYLCDVPLADAVGRVRGVRKDAEEAVPGIIGKITDGLSPSRALSAGHVRTVEIVRRASDALSLLPAARFPFAPALATALSSAADVLGRFNKQQVEEIAPRRAPLKAAVERGILELRETMEQMNGRLRTHFPASFIDSLYPDLDSKGRAVLSDADEDDDDSVTVTPG